VRGGQATDTGTPDENAHAHSAAGVATTLIETVSSPMVAIRFGTDIISRLLAVQATETQF
jgi:hypothetical protein